MPVRHNSSILTVFHHHLFHISYSDEKKSPEHLEYFCKKKKKEEKKKRQLIKKIAAVCIPKDSYMCIYSMYKVLPQPSFYKFFFHQSPVCGPDSLF